MYLAVLVISVYPEGLSIYGFDSIRVCRGAIEGFSASDTPEDILDTSSSSNPSYGASETSERMSSKLTSLSASETDEISDSERTAKGLPVSGLSLLSLIIGGLANGFPFMFLIFSFILREIFFSM